MLGAGMFSEIHLAAWIRVGNAKVVALCDPHEQRRRLRGAQAGIEEKALCATLEEALARHAFDVVDIVTPLETHCALATTAADAGKHILCQKPFAPSATEGRKVLAACRRYGVRLMVAEAFRWRAHYIAIKRFLDAGELGDVYFARISAKAYYSPRWENGAAMRQPFLKEMPRLILQEMGPHWFDVHRWLFGEPHTVKCACRRVSAHARGEDLAVVLLEHRNMLGMIEASWASREFLQGKYNRADGTNTMDQVLIEGTRASLRLDPDGVLEIIGNRGERETVAYEPGEYLDAHVRLQRHFLDCLASGEPFATSGEDNIRVLELIEAAYAASTVAS